ncbi:unnamed protein product [Chrysoparadoxa australica]
MESKEDYPYDHKDGHDDNREKSPASSVVDSDEEVEREYRAAMAKKNEGGIQIATTPWKKELAEGFVINWMNMRDADNGEELWTSGTWGAEMFKKEMEARIPKRLLKCEAVSREINFTSRGAIEHFRLEQRIFLNGACLEEWFFDFGYVIPGSTNSWQQTIEAADVADMRSHSELSGKMTIETGFFDGDDLLSKARLRVYYV